MPPSSWCRQPRLRSGNLARTEGSDSMRRLWSHLALALAALGGALPGQPVSATNVIEYLIPTSNSVPLSIVAGPDGAVWFAENNANKIGRITTTGTLKE